MLIELLHATFSLSEMLHLEFERRLDSKERIFAKYAKDGARRLLWLEKEEL
jgi:hypothetical protein